MVGSTTCGDGHERTLNTALERKSASLYIDAKANFLAEEDPWQLDR